MEGGEAFRCELKAGPLGDVLPVGLAVECACVVGMAVCPVVLFEDLVRHAGGGDKGRVGVDVRMHAEHAAEVEDNGAG